MSRQLSVQKMSALLVLSIVAPLSGCYQTLPATWGKDVPGLYEGRHSGFREVLELRSDGSFHHELFKGDQSIFAESGKWTAPPGEFIIKLDAFTQFYDPVAQKFSSEGRSFVAYQFGPLRDGKSFTKISASVDFEYCLVRKQEIAPK
jgi:hypothetical protein